MSKDQKIVVKAAQDLRSISSHFQILKKITDEIPKNYASIQAQANKVSAAGFQQLLTNEGKKIETHVDLISDEIDQMLAIHQAHNEYLRKRIAFWTDAAAKIRFRRNMANGEVDFAETGNSSTLLNSTQGNHSSLLEKENHSGTSGQGELKKPTLDDYEFSETTMAVLKGEKPIASGVGITKPRLENYHFRTVVDNGQIPNATFQSTWYDEPVLRKPQMPFLPTVMQTDELQKREAAIPVKPQMPLLRSLNQYREKPAAAAMQFLEKPHDEGNDGKCCRSKSSGGGGSLTGSYLEGPPNDGNVDFLIMKGPVVRADLGFDDITASFVDENLTGQLALAKQKELLEQSLKAQQNSTHKPPMPRLRPAIDEDLCPDESPSRDGRRLRKE